MQEGDSSERKDQNQPKLLSACPTTTGSKQDDRGGRKGITPERSRGLLF